jgi:hypothetical protein
MTRKIAKTVWMVTAADPSIPHFGMRPDESMEIHGYVEWVSNRFVIYFSHVTHQTPEREVRDLEPVVYPVPMNEYICKAAAMAIMAEFWPILWDQNVRPASELADRMARDLVEEHTAFYTTKTSRPVDEEEAAVLKELQDAIDSIDDEGNITEPGTDGDQ